MAINLNIFQFIYNLNRFFPTNVPIGLFCGEYLIYILGIVILLYLLLSKEPKQEKIKWLSILILACCFSNVMVTPAIHYVYKSERPFLVMPEVGNYKNFLKVTEYTKSFPSGHTALAFALAMVLFLYNKKTGIAAFAVAFLVGLGRILMGVHWPLDVLGGIGVGILCGWIAYGLISRLFSKTTAIK